FILMQAGHYLTDTRGLGVPEAGICYERAEPLCHSLNRPLQLYVALIGQWRYSLHTDKLTATMQIARRVYSLAQEQKDSALLIGAYRALACTLYFMGDFESARQDAINAVQIWRSGGVQYHVEEVFAPVITSLCYEAMSDWHFGKIASSRVRMGEAISLAKELNDMHGLANALLYAACRAHFEGNPTEVKHCASELIELSTRQNFASWLAAGEILRGWECSASGDTAEGIESIFDGIDDWPATGSTVLVPYYLALKAEVLHLADRTLEALEAIRRALVVCRTAPAPRSVSHGYWC